MVHGFAKNLLARRWGGVVGFEHAVGDEDLARLAALWSGNRSRVVDGQDGMRGVEAAHSTRCWRSATQSRDAIAEESDTIPPSEDDDACRRKTASIIDKTVTCST
jgi:hypothetical protein